MTSNIVVTGKSEDIKALAPFHSEAALSGNSRSAFQLFVIWTLWAILLKLHRTQP